MLVKRTTRNIKHLPLKTSVVIATPKDIINSNNIKKDFDMYYIHGLKYIDIPKKEIYTISTMQEITESDFLTNKEAFVEIERSKLMTIKEIKNILRDKSEHRLTVKKNAILAEYSQLKGAKK